MKKMQGRKRKADGLFAVAFWQFMAFSMLILVIWVNEMVDLSSLWFGGMPEGMNVFRGFVLTAVAIVVAVVTVGHTYVQQKRIISGLLTVCAECRKIRVDEESWTQLDDYISEHSLALISHGLCPRCFEIVQQQIRDMAPTPITRS